MIKVLKRFVITLVAVSAFAGASFAQPKSFPPPQGMLSDYSGKISPAARQNIETLLRNFRDRSGVEIALVTLDYDQMQGYPIEEYTLYLGRSWGVGRDAQKRALLLLIAIKPPDAQGIYSGQTRLEVSRHLEGEIPDGLAGEIIRRLRDDMRAGRFDQAATNGAQTLMATLAQKLGISMEGIDQTKAYREPERRSSRGRGLSPFAIIILIFVVLSIFGSFGGGGGGGRGGRRRRGLGLDWMLLPIIFGSGRGGGNWGGFGGGSGGSSWGGGGDFGGFGGGGDFGGGGASDSW
jgi:uncharacterized protein